MDMDPELQKQGALIWMVFILALFIVFLVLKLCAVIAWPWLWVCAPLWIPLAIGLVGMALGIKPPQ
jgi:1,4-dihydroxy-2-naphthoate octaprenyltransferase